MILTFAEDFTSNETLDAQLMGIPESGLYFNRGVHPVVTIKNLISLLPSSDITFSEYSETKTYSKYEISKNKNDIVSYEGKIYQSLVDNNINKQPNNNSDYWLETNLISLKIKSFIWSSRDNVLSAINLNRKLVENQYIYNVGSETLTLSNDYSAWVFEPRGSDYIKIVINQICLQAKTTEDVNLYVINQGKLIDTIVLHPSNGLLEFEDIGYTINLKGETIFAFKSQDVISDITINRYLKYDGFICYPATGIGDVPNDINYNRVSEGNGLNFNITAYFDSDVYINNNEIYFAKLIQSQFEVDFLRMLISNTNAESNNIQQIIGYNKDILVNEAVNVNDNTVARRYMSQIKAAKKSINRTFDNFIQEDIPDFEVDIGTI